MPMKSIYPSGTPLEKRPHQILKMIGTKCTWPNGYIIASGNKIEGIEATYSKEIVTIEGK